MFFSIRHVTRFNYASPVSESIMETRMHPRNEGTQRCTTFQLSVSPRAHVMSYRDYLGNIIHHFDVPGHHAKLLIVAESVVDLRPSPPIPRALHWSAWQELDQQIHTGDYWEMLMPSQFAQPTPLLRDLCEKLDVRRRDDPLSLLREVNAGIYHWFEYEPKRTRVDSPIDDALRERTGVCQDFAHVMIALVRNLKIPCRYVSGYLHHAQGDLTRSVDGATHAWVEALLPGLGWVGFDPTNNQLAGDRHIRTAIGRDYADVPPTRGIFKGRTESSLSVNVRVDPSDTLAPEDEELMMTESWSTFLEQEPESMQQSQQQQQQQQ